MLLSLEERFLAEKELYASEKKQPHFLLYWVYLHWCLELRTEPIPMKKFLKFLRQYFKRSTKVTWTSFYYASCPEIDVMDHVEKWIALNDYRQYKKEEYKKKHNKKQRTKKTVL